MSNYLLDLKRRELNEIKLRSQVDTLREKLKDATNTNQKNIETTGPQIEVTEIVKWRKYPIDTSFYAIEVFFGNSGKRAAEDFLVVAEIYYLDSTTQKYSLLKKGDSGISKKHWSIPVESSNRQQVIHYGVDNFTDITKLNFAILLRVNIQYSDKLTMKKYNVIRYFKWEGFNKDLYKFNSTGIDESLIASMN